MEVMGENGKFVLIFQDSFARESTFLKTQHKKDVLGGKCFLHIFGFM